ncbi:MAG: transporter substrate-binding domain-containing protein [Eubacterium sp.]|nr:transporter substrate-binding domain-containing protein [Eubacterium sp.]MBQ8980898.1 transporter substrate-binding domain-containing protein [Eubacterium sp.]MBR2277848.1 transporter substrate-binding domain-containing protein [Eubacterium sp.]
MKRIFALVLCALLVFATFAGCSKKDKEKYSDEKLIIGYTEAADKILKINEGGKASGFEADLMKAIFNGIKGDFKSYTFEKVDEGYELEKDGGFFDSKDKEYSAGLLMGVVTTNRGTFNEDYSFTDPIISDRVIAVAAKDSDRKGFAEFKNARVLTVGEVSAEALKKNSQIASVCKSVTPVQKIDDALKQIDSGKADIVVTDEFTFMPTKKADSYKVFDGELDRIDYVIACAKYSGWKDSINEAVYELKSKDYGKGDEFTPIVKKAFGYNASSFDWKPSETK